jgi:hypothetical protein
MAQSCKQSQMVRAQLKHIYKPAPPSLVPLGRGPMLHTLLTVTLYPYGIQSHYLLLIPLLIQSSYMVHTYGTHTKFDFVKFR